MLTGLHLRDFALAERVELDLQPGFTVITGETGAGKSVLIQALTFALGSLADAEMIRPGAEAAEVEATFELSGSDAYGPVARLLSDADIPFEGELIVRRTLTRPRPAHSDSAGACGSTIGRPPWASCASWRRCSPTSTVSENICRSSGLGNSSIYSTASPASNISETRYRPWSDACECSIAS